MKYLKHWIIFESIGYDIQEISRNEYNDLINDRAIFQPNQVVEHQISEINKFLSKWNITLRKIGNGWQDDYGYSFYNLDINYNGGEDYQLDISIIPIEDEWFLLNVREYKYPTGWDLSGRELPYYKCDQLGGLLEFIEMKMKDLKPKRKKKNKYGR